MTTAQFYLSPIDVFPGRDGPPLTFDLYEEDGETQMEITADDNIRFKVWAVNGAAPDIEAESLNPGSESSVDVSSLGTGGVSAARVVVKMSAADTAGLTVGTQYWGELLLIDESDDDAIKPLGRFPINVITTATGDVSL